MNNLDFDIAIIGGGLNGIAMAALLAKTSLKIALIDQNLISSRINSKADGRGIAVARFSKNILIKHGIWKEFNVSHGTINRVVVADGSAPFLLKLDNEIIDGEALGHIIEHDDLLHQFYNYVLKQPNIEVLDGRALLKFTSSQTGVELELEDRSISTKLMIAADGKNSKIREQLEISSSCFDYQQKALVFNIKHEFAHDNIAYEHFYKAGPFAMLPLNDVYKSSVVWTERPELADLYAKMSKEELEFFVQERAKLTHGKVEICSKVFSYPLSLVIANKYYKERVVLIGDSLHFIHPIAGQGFNLSLRDIDCLCDLIKAYSDLGLDIGSNTLLSEFARSRKLDNYAMIVFTDLLNRGFSNNNKIISLARKLGLSLIDIKPKLQSYLLNYAWTKK